ncbi:MAG TPA: Rrf2 family transcriptional regulator [Bryobacteraceae bacterium]|nr:Rrf2 family transcriptional regulator [Bryobacteraceae bacterium]
MIYYRPSEYAIRALVHLAEVPRGTYAVVRQIAAEEQIPSYFLSKILQQLARKGLLRSRKGPGGGFALRAPADEIPLLNVVQAVDGLADYQKCVCGFGDCSEDMPCVLHKSWKALRSRVMNYLRRKTIADLETVEQNLLHKRQHSKRARVRRASTS